MGKIVKKVADRAKKLISKVGASILGSAPTAGSAPVMPKPVTKVTPKAAQRGGMAGEMEDPIAKSARRRGKASTVATGARGITGNVETTKKTLLGR